MNNNYLMDLQEKVERYQALERRKASLGEQKQMLFTEECRLAVVRAKEDSDVEKWENGSLAAFFYGLVGKREERIEKEKAEAYEAAMEHDAVKAQLTAVERDLDKVNGELERLKGCEWEYKRAVDEKAAALAAEGKDNGILELQQAQAKIKEQLREVEEALAAGNAAMTKIHRVNNFLDSAKSWGTWDMLGGDIISTMMKHEKLREAQLAIEDMYVELRRFRTELSDVKMDMEMEMGLQVEIDGFTKVADYIFDCIFVDWEVQSQIKEAQRKVAKLKGQLEDAMNSLRQLEGQLDEKSIKLKADWQKKITQM